VKFALQVGTRTNLTESGFRLLA